MTSRLHAVRARRHRRAEVIGQATVTFMRNGTPLAGLQDLPCKFTADLDTLVDSELQIEAVITLRTAVLPADETRPNATCRAVVTDWLDRTVTYTVLRWVAQDGTVPGIERGELKRVTS